MCSLFYSVFQFLDILIRCDKKMDRILTGVGDGCDSCITPRNLWHDLDSINAGFPMNRSFESVQEAWDNLDRNKQGGIIKRTADFEQRQGVCHQPKTARPTNSFTITHKVILSLFHTCLTRMNYIADKIFGFQINRH